MENYKCKSVGIIGSGIQGVCTGLQLLKKNIPTKPTKPISSVDILVFVNLIAKTPCPITDKTIKK